MSGKTPAEAGKECSEPDCGGWAMDNGKCFHCGGQNYGEDHGASEGNTNAVQHGAYVDMDKRYNQVFNDRQRDLTDWVFRDYYERYQSIHGAEPPNGFKMRLFNVAVNVVTEMRVNNWYEDKPDELDSGVDGVNTEKHVSENGQVYYRYKKSPHIAAVKHLESYNRKWLKDLKLLPSDDSADVEVNVTAEMWDDLTGYYEG